MNDVTQLPSSTSALPETGTSATGLPADIAAILDFVDLPSPHEQVEAEDEQDMDIESDDEPTGAGDPSDSEEVERALLMDGDDSDEESPAS